MELYKNIPVRLAEMVNAKLADLEAISNEICPKLQAKPTLASQFLASMRSADASYILEFKPASPSKGDINTSADISSVIESYQPFATAISVLVDKQFFKGGYDYLQKARELTNKPLLCKDIIFDSRQIIEGKRCGADIVLLMLSVLSDQLYRELYDCAKTLGLAVISEVTNADECMRLQSLPVECVGINHRDFADLSIDLDKTHDLIDLIPSDLPVIAESGIYKFDDFKRIHPRANSFLIGSSLMESANLSTSLRRMLFGDIKVCGVTIAEQALAMYHLGATHIGLIFYPESPRYVQNSNAFIEVSKNVPLVGVFVNHSISDILEITQSIQLCAIQLHGDEDIDFIVKLRGLLNESIQIWKAVHEIEECKALVAAPIDQYLLDGGSKSARGGTGLLADWSSVPSESKAEIRLAGGLSPENIALALEAGFKQFDFNSKIETSHGVKNIGKFQQCIQQILDFRSNKL